MTPKAQRIAIAEACGWKSIHERPIDSTDDLPDYLNDLNAMHEAEKVLIPGQWPKYLRELTGILESEHRFEVENRFAEITSTAAQRAEAFLRTLGLWKE